MIHVFFVPGMFGSTVEYVLSDFTCEMTPTHAKIKFDGSMHTFLKQNHPGSSGGLVFSLREINTPLYPFTDLELPDILTRYPSRAEDSHILLYAPSVDAAEQNMLFQYHKISVGSRYGLQIFYGRDTEAEKNVRPWNQHYKSHSDMRPWEFREWFSLFYPGWIQAWQSSVDQVDHTWLKIPCSDVLNHTEHTFRKIIKFCKLTEKNGLAKFAAQWRKAQQYVIDEYDLINGIVASTVAAQPLQWRELNPIAEAIIQKKLRDLGWEIRCHDLDIFPRDSIQLYSLLESNVQLHQQGNT